MNHNRIEELKKLINIARENYYNLSPNISDQEYDALVDELKLLEPEAKEVLAVGAPTPKFSVWEKVPHEIQMGSLNKVNSEKEFDEWVTKSNAKTYFITHKIDGSSMELVYKSGKLVKCITRGDGIVGEDVFVNVSQIPSVPKNLPIDIDIIVRGEVVMTKEVFKEKYSEEYANPRNTAASKVREKKGGGEACKDLEFLAYWISMKEDAPKTMFFTFQWLKGHGFKIPDCVTTTLDNMSQLKSFYKENAENRNNVPYEIDGMVVSVNDLELLQELGETGMRPKGQIAWKFDSAKAISKVNNVVWQVGPSGRITPVAIVEPIGIGGVTITNISLHNLSLFRNLKLFKGCRVLISRRNDVIPFIEKNLDSE